MPTDPPLPAPAPSTAKMRADNLRLLSEDARRYLVAERPATDALMSVLLKPRDVVLREYVAGLDRFRGMIAGAPGSESLQDHLGRPLGQGPAAIEALATAMVAKGFLGDMGAAALIADRIEGRVGPRKLADGEEGANRGEMAAKMEELVEMMYARVERRPGDDAKDITVKPNGAANGHDPN
jgi:hypothetical protein